MKSILSVVRKCIAVIGSVAMMITLMTVIIPTQPAAAAESACVQQAWTRLNNAKSSCKLAASPGNMQTMYFKNRQNLSGTVNIKVVPDELAGEDGTCSRIVDVTIPSGTATSPGSTEAKSCTTSNRDYILSIVLTPETSQEVFYFFSQPIPLRLPH